MDNSKEETEEEISSIAFNAGLNNALQHILVNGFNINTDLNETNIYDAERTISYNVKNMPGFSSTKFTSTSFSCGTSGQNITATGPLNVSYMQSSSSFDKVPLDIDLLRGRAVICGHIHGVFEKYKEMPALEDFVERCIPRTVDDQQPLFNKIGGMEIKTKDYAGSNTPFYRDVLSLIKRRFFFDNANVRTPKIHITSMDDQRANFWFILRQNPNLVPVGGLRDKFQFFILLFHTLILINPNYFHILSNCKNIIISFKPTGGGIAGALGRLMLGRVSEFIDSEHVYYIERDNKEVITKRIKNQYSNKFLLITMNNETEEFAKANDIPVRKFNSYKDLREFTQKVYGINETQSSFEDEYRHCPTCGKYYSRSYSRSKHVCKPCCL
uniref:Uncharacterized protein n=1 Tax=Meloidogyne hapla TaxID=6305 RepID=A0A1I8BMD6_MELHA